MPINYEWRNIMTDNVKNLSAEDMPWLIFSLCGRTYTVKSESVTGIMTIPDRITPVPSAPEIYRGITDIRGSVHPVLDMRRLFGFPSLDDECREFTAMLDQREKDHIEWANELKRCVEADVDFTLTTDPHACKFGRWYDEFKSNPHNADYSLHKIEIPHNELHKTAALIAYERKKPDSPERTHNITELLNLVTDEYVPEIIDIMDEAKRRYKSFYRETMVTFSKEGSRLAMIVDKVLAVDKIEHISGRENMSKILSSKFFTGVARSRRIDDEILVIDENKIIQQAEKDIPETDE